MECIYRLLKNNFREFPSQHSWNNFEQDFSKAVVHPPGVLFVSSRSQSPGAFSIGSPSRLFSAESALINKLSKTNKSELSGIGDAVMSCIDKIKM